MKAPYKHNRTRWSRPDREWMEHHHFVLGKTYKQMANEIGCVKDTIVSWAKDLGVSWKHLVKKGEIHAPFKVSSNSGKGSSRFYGVTKQWLTREYVENDKSSWQIADSKGHRQILYVNG